MQLSQKKRLQQICITVLLLAVTAINFSAVLDKQAEAPIGDAFERALITYGVVRGINAVVSVIQGTEVAIEPAGVGVILSPGEMFDPVNDLIERFSLVVLIASTSLGAQKILVGIGSTLLVQVAVAIAAFIQLAGIWKPAWLESQWGTVLRRVTLLLLMLRFLIPSAVLINDVVYQHYLDQQYTESYSQLEQARQEVEALQEAESDPLPEAVEGGILDQIGRLYDRTAQRINVDARLEEYEQRLANASEQIIDLIVVFVLQTLVFPLLFLWLGLKVIRLVFSSRMIFHRHSHTSEASQ
ncbi:MAG: hypothetical protein AB8B95_12815 [Pseudohongiellaceae bacterium]